MTTWLLLTLIAHAEVHETEAVPSEAVVYADRALVTRSASVTVGAGRQEVVFVGLPVRIDSNSVTADATGSGTLAGVDVRRVPAAVAADERVKEIEAELSRLGDLRRVAADEETAAKAELTAVGTARGEAAKALSSQLLVGSRGPERSRSLRRALATEEERARDRVREAQRAGRDLDTEIAALKRERSSLGSSGTDTWTAVVRLDVARAGRVSVDLHYIVYGATWRPRYDIRADATAGGVELALSALVTQATGEDWDEVQLTVSSAQPGLGTTVPRLDPFWLQPPRPPARASRSSGFGGGGMAESAAPMAMDMDEDYFEPEPEPMVVAQATVDTQLAATTFVVTRPETVGSDGTERKVLLTTESLEADLRHITAPRLDPRAYLVGEVENTAPFPLLAGEAGVFLDGAYLGDFFLDTVAPGEEFDLAFGVDDKVTVRRIPREQKLADTRLGGKRAVSRWGWDIEVRNGHGRAITVDIREQIPVATHDDVTVEHDVEKGTATPVQDDGGMLRWTFELGARAETTIQWGYRVEYPADQWLGWME